MERNCKGCREILGCKYYNPFFEQRKRFVLVHHYLETDFMSIVAFSDCMSELCELKLNLPHYGSIKHDYFVAENVFDSISLTWLKDSNLLNICKNVAEYLAIGEYAMLKKSYFKSASWFEKAKNSAALGAEIIYNY